ncbi:hypothetical protein FHS31_002654 [Sphingomonas vulcanisoli]|uniref:Helix-turn-helix domain-containing protein n=1 Tax=Sphingomonas vulcanisoli TaxID=1658060 RepID=A0ABX0TU21_9SPHN|nr:hypothetical protein [Sphingomonas vulcanisoli]NIJ09024.1 hypothetical protein [Sphingomonas vulcanisoli]
MNDLTPLRIALDAAELGDAARPDGWTGARRRSFLESLAEGHTVEAACRIVGLSVASAYALRRRAGGEAFALGWRAACLLARDALADTLTSRAIDGQVDTYTRADGEQVTRHRFDNRLAMAVLTRLDRLAEPPAERGAGAGAAATERPAPSADDPAQAARAVAADFPAFLDLITQEGADWRAFVAAAIALHTPQLPQLREGAGDGDDDAEYEFWWDEGWRTDRPPPPNFQGYQNGEPGDLGYWRKLTRREIRGVEAEGNGRG